MEGQKPELSYLQKLAAEEEGGKAVNLNGEIISTERCVRA